MSARPALRLVVDPGVLVSAAVSGRGAATQVLEQAVDGRATLVVSPLLLDELGRVLERRKFRRYISIAEAADFVNAVKLLAEFVEDPPPEVRERICREPDDDYLIALLHASGAAFIVSGDRDLTELDHPGVDVRSPRQALAALEYEHPWGGALIPGSDASAWRQAETEGHSGVLETAAAVLHVLTEPDAAHLLAFVVTPESLEAWSVNLQEIGVVVANRGMTSRAEYPAPDVAYVKVPPDPGASVRAVETVLLLADSIVMTLQRRVELPDVLGLGGRRAHGIGGYVRPEDMPG